MDPVTANVLIDRPREEVFDYLADIANHPEFSDHYLTEWRLTRVDSILRAILRAGAYEILQRSDVPARVTISEFVDIAHAFFAEDEPKVVNGILDGIARKARPKEFAAGGPRDD